MGGAGSHPLQCRVDSNTRVHVPVTEKGKLRSATFVCAWAGNYAIRFFSEESSTAAGFQELEFKCASLSGRHSSSEAIAAFVWWSTNAGKYEGPTSPCHHDLAGILTSATWRHC